MAPHSQGEKGSPRHTTKGLRPFFVSKKYPRVCPEDIGNVGSRHSAFSETQKSGALGGNVPFSSALSHDGLNLNAYFIHSED